MENPFATRFTRPGAIDFVFPPDITSRSLVDRLQASNWRGQIIGPHGAGKTTLLHALCRDVQSRGVQIISIPLHDGQRSAPLNTLSRTTAQPCLVIVDGYEQLSRWCRWRLLQRCKRLGCGLLVTAHKDVGLPSLYEVRPTLQILQRLAGQLADATDWSVSDDELETLYEQRGQNIRECLFALYDAYERQNRSLPH